MIISLTSALIKDILTFLKTENKFFELSKEKRTELALEYFGSKSFAVYLADISEAGFLEDLKISVRTLKGSTLKKGEKSEMIEALASYFLNEFFKSFDRIDKNFFESDEEEQKNTLKKLFPKDTVFFDHLRKFVYRYSAQEMTEQLVNILKNIYDSPRVVVQSPIEAACDTKNSIRDYFKEKQPQSFVAFNINPQLIGGLRFIVEGEVEDMSWFKRIQSFHKLYSNI